MDINDFTDEQAQSLCDFIIRREPARLSDLAYWMRDAGGPVELMDASLDSLLPLWEWFLGFVNSGCPGVPEYARPESFQRHVPNQFLDERHFGAHPALHWRAAFASESLEHYLMAVLRRIDPTAHWAVYSGSELRRVGAVDVHQQWTGIRMSAPRDHFVWLPLPVTVSLLQLKAEREAGQRDDWMKARYAAPDWLLRTIVDHRLSKETVPKSQPREPSILLPFLEALHVPWNAPERVPPRLNEDLRNPQTVSSAKQSGDCHWLIARRPPKDYGEQMSAGVEEMSLYPPMDAGRLAAGLTKLGFTDLKGLPVTAVTLLADDEGFMHPDFALRISDFVFEGSVRQLWVEGIGFVSKLAKLKRDLGRLAKSIKAELTEGDYN